MLKKLLVSAALITLGTGAALAQDLSTMSWDDVVAQAKTEGEVNWYVWYYQDDFRKAVESFEEEYGISVNIPAGGSARGNADKLLAASGADKGDIDVFAWGYGDMSTLDMSAQFTPLDMLPEDDSRVSEINGIDGGDYVLAYWGNQTGLVYDPAKIDEADLPQTPEEIGAYWAAQPGTFGFNYENGGAGPSFYMNMLRALTPDVDFYNGETSDEKIAALDPALDFFREHGGEYVITTSNADNITRVSDGELTMASAWEDQLASLQNSGEVRDDLKLYIPDFGMNGGGNGVAIPANAPHPAAAAVFINWLTSAETQTMFNQTFGTAPMNTEADDSHALIPNAQRANRVAEPAQPFAKAAQDAFINDVMLEL